MTAQQLKNSILQMAVQGKLVPQDPTDEPASVLLERIRAEKERLIKEKKIKREKNPSVIFRGADNLPYEKVGDEVRSLADEVPFDIPNSWEWVRMGTVIELQSGQDMTPDKYNDCGKGIPYITGASNIENGNVLINRWTEYGRSFAYCGDILLTCKGTVGTMAVLQEPQVHIARQIMSIRPIAGLYVPFIQLVLDTLVENLKAAAKSMIPGIAREDVLQSLFPVPPISEQKRLVQKVSELSTWLEQYAVADTKLLSLNTAFPEALKKSILQEAVQGKLVPQDPNDEPASALLERIRTEKDRLIKAGKIKRDKHDSVIFRRDNSHYEKRGSEEICIDKEIPFSLPDGWCWCRFSNICYKLADGSHNPPPKKSKGFRVISARNIKNNKILFTDEDRLCDQMGFEKENPRTQISRGDVILGIIGGSIGNTAIYEYDEPVIAQRSIAIFGSLINNRYMKLLLDSPLFQQQFTSKSNGTAQGGIYLGELSNMLVPLPPENEQNRILASISVLEKHLASM